MQPQETTTAVLERPTYRARARELRDRRPAFSADLAESFLARAADALRRDPLQARQCARLALYVARRLEDAALCVRSLRALAQVDMVAGRYPEALRAIDDALARLRPAGTPRERADLRALRVQALTQLERFAEAGETGRRVLRTLEELGDERGIIRIRMALADLAIQLERPREALRHFRQVEYLLPEDAAPRLRGAIAANRGNALRACQRFRASERWLRLARDLFEGEGCEHTVAQIDYNLAYSLVRRGHYEEALRRFASLDERFERLGDDMHRAHIDLNRAELYLHVQLPDEARGHAERAAAAFGALGLERDRGEAEYFAGRAAALSGELEQAAERYADARRRFADLRLPSQEVNCVVHLAYLAQRLGRPVEAEALAREAQGLVAACDDRVAQASVRLLLANLELAAGRAAEAVEHARSVTESLRRRYAPWMLVEAGRVEGRARHELGQHRRAAAAYRAAVDVLERVRAGVPPDEYMTAYLGARAELYEELVELLVADGRAEEAFGYAERAKSRALLDLLVRGVAEEVEPDGPHAARIRVLRETLNSVYWQLFQSAGAPREPRDCGTPSAHRPAAELEDELQRLLRDRRWTGGAHVAPLLADVPSPEALRARLEPGTVFLDYLRTRHGLVIFVVTRDGVRALRLALEEGEIEERVQRFRYHLAKHERSRMGAEALVLCATRDNLARLRERLLDPVAEHLRGRRLVVSAHGPLHGVPFHALPWGEGWLCDAFEVLYAPSAAVYTWCAQPRERAAGAPAVFGVPDAAAPHVEQEARRVAELLETDRLHLGAEATLDALHRAAPDAAILHVATHGVFRRANPLLSAVRLGDGWATPYDLRGLRARGRLVVLSTCESGVAGVSAGNEILGLARAFLHAGAPALLCTQWRVRDDVAEQFMRAFYEALRDGADAAEAHGQAMAIVRSDHPHPFFWAPWFFLGAPVSAAPAAADDARPSLPPPTEGTTR